MAEIIEIEVITRAQIFTEGAEKGWYNILSGSEVTYLTTKQKAITAYKNFKREFGKDFEMRIVKIPAESHYIEQFQIWYKR